MVSLISLNVIPLKNIENSPLNKKEKSKVKNNLFPITWARMRRPAWPFARSALGGEGRVGRRDVVYAWLRDVTSAGRERQRGAARFIRAHVTRNTRAARVISSNGWIYEVAQLLVCTAFVFFPALVSAPNPHFRERNLGEVKLSWGIFYHGERLGQFLAILRTSTTKSRVFIPKNRSNQ